MHNYILNHAAMYIHTDLMNELQYELKDKFESHFVPWRNVVFERAKFNQRGNKKMGKLWMLL